MGRGMARSGVGGGWRGRGGGGGRVARSGGGGGRVARSGVGVLRTIPTCRCAQSVEPRSHRRNLHRFSRMVNNEAIPIKAITDQTLRLTFILRQL